MKKALKIIRGAVVVIASLLFAAWIALQSSTVQTSLAKMVMDSLGSVLSGEINVEKIHFKPFNAVVLKGVSVIDNDPAFKGEEKLDTIFKAKTVVATFSLRGMRKNGIIIRNASIEDGYFALVNEERGSNIKRLIVTKKKKEKPASNFKIKANTVKLSNFRFRMISFKNPRPDREYGIDWKNLDVRVSDLLAKKVKYADKTVTGKVEQLSAIERSGYNIQDIAGDVIVAPGITDVTNLHIKDSWSDINADRYKMEYDNVKSFSNYLDDVKMSGTLRKSMVNLKSISYFAPGLKDKALLFDVDYGNVEGPVNDLNIKKIDFKEIGSSISGHVETRLFNITKLKSASLVADVKNLAITTAGIESFISRFFPTSNVKISKFAPEENFIFNGKGSGKLNDLTIKGEATSLIGSAFANVKIIDILNKNLKIVGGLTTKDLDLSKVLKVKQLGKTSLRAGLEAGFKPGATSVKIDSLVADKFSLLGYEYSNIAAAGTYSEKEFNGRIVCSDPNLNFLFQGIFALSDKTKNRVYNFYTNVGYADLYALHLDKRGTSKVSGQINANYMNVNNGDLLGSLEVSNLVLENAEGRQDVGKISIQSHGNDNIKRMTVNSKVADATFVGTRPILRIFKDIKDLTIKRELPDFFNEQLPDWDGDSYEVNLDVHKVNTLLSFIKSGLYVADSTNFKLNVNDKGILSAKVKSSRLALGKNYLKNVVCNVSNDQGSLNGNISSSEMSLASFKFLNNNIMLYAKNNHVGVGYSYGEESELENNKGEIYITGDIGRNANGELLIKGKTLPSNLYVNQKGWKISDSKIDVIGNNIKVDNLMVSSEDQFLKLYGGFSPEKKDTLALVLSRFDVSALNPMMSSGQEITGFADGRVLLLSPVKNDGGLILNIACDSMTVDKQRIGKLQLASAMENGKMLILANNNLDGKTPFKLTGDYDLKNDKINLRANLDRMESACLAPLLSSFLSEVQGPVSGLVKIGGSSKNISLSSSGTRFDDVRITVDYTKVPYNLNGPFHVNDNGLFFDDVSISDFDGGTATASGGILFENLKNFRMSTKIKLGSITCLNTNVRDNPDFYGKVIASGELNITGPFNAILLDLNGWTDKAGDFHIPLDQASSNGSSDLLTFKEEYHQVYIDPYEQMMNSLTESEKKSKDLRIKLKINVNPDVEAYVEVDKDAGNMLRGRGHGNIDINVRPSRDLFTINGAYTLNEGNFRFNAMNIAQREFSITEGSNIRFNGEIMDSDLDINGRYTTKTSVATLIADTSAVSTRRTVNCEIGISGKLREPVFAFDVNVPDLDPTTKAKVESALNTEDKVQKQLLSLLISNGFIPDEQSGIVNNNSMIYSNITEIMAGQLNNILQKLDIPLDFGLNYQSYDNGANIFDVAVSTQLFNNKVLINGAFGNREYNKAGTEDTMVGDLDIEIKLNKSGQLRLNLFSHSADDYSTYLDNTQRNGLGITYQKEFNSLRELLIELFSSKKKKEEMRNNSSLEEAEKNTVIIKNDNE